QGEVPTQLNQHHCSFTEAGAAPTELLGRLDARPADVLELVPQVLVVARLALCRRPDDLRAGHVVEHAAHHRAQLVPVDLCSHGSPHGSRGRPSTRSPITVRWMWLVPPPMIHAHELM